MKDNLVSIVVTTKNEEENIENCLRSIQLQTWRSIEIIVVDNYSVDKTVEISKRYTEKVYNLGPERSAQRNFGLIEKSEGNYLMYIDADMILSPKLVEACIFEVIQKNLDALHIHEFILGSNLFSKVRNFERSFYSGTVIDGARFFTKNIFCKTQGFDEVIFKEGSGEDWDLDKSIRKYGGKIGLLPKETNKTGDCNLTWGLKPTIEYLGASYSDNLNCIYHNESKIKLTHYLRKKIYYARGFDGYINKWGKKDVDVYRQLGFKYRYITVFCENRKWIKIIKNPLLFLGMYYLRVRLGVAYLYYNLMK